MSLADVDGRHTLSRCGSDAAWRLAAASVAVPVWFAHHLKRTMLGRRFYHTPSLTILHLYPDRV
jgi:hypothetical protein